VHSAQGVIADTTHAVVGENTSRAMLVRGNDPDRESNTVCLYARGMKRPDTGMLSRTDGM